MRTPSTTDSNAGAAPMRRRTLHGEIATLMRDMIVTGELPAGERINESELGPRLGVSRTPLREAIRTLASEGLVELVPSKGAVVCRFDVDDVAHMLDAIKLLEQGVAALACERASDHEIAAIQATHATMMRHYRKRERMAYYKLNQSIHSAIVALAHNPTISEVHEVLQARLKRIRYIGNGEPAKWADAVAEHEAMVTALARRDAAALSRVLGEHMDHTLSRVASSL